MCWWLVPKILHRRGRQERRRPHPACDWWGEKGYSIASLKLVRVICFQSGEFKERAVNQATSICGRKIVGLGDIYRSREHCDLGRWVGERRFNAASKAFVAAGDNHNNASILAQLGNVRRAQGRAEESQELFLRALATHEQTRDLPNQGKVMSFLGSLLLDLKRLPEAFEYYQRALEIFERVGDTRQIGILHGNVGRLKHHLGQPKKRSNPIRAV